MTATMAYFIGYRQSAPNALYFRKTIELTKPIAQAYLDFSALGIVKPYCNGAALGEDMLSPGWTDYHVRIPYCTLEVTERLQMGANVFAFAVGHGWAVGRIAWFGSMHYSSRPLLWCRIRLRYTDGSEAEFGSMALREN